MTITPFHITVVVLLINLAVVIGKLLDILSKDEAVRDRA